MQGEPRSGARVIPLTVNAELLRQFDALVQPKGRSRAVEKLMWEKVLRHKLTPHVAEDCLREMLQLID